MTDETFSSVDLVSQCLIDTQKIDAYKAALRKVANKDFSVIDLGAGSGILGMLAAREGFKKVLAVEIDPYIGQIAEKNILTNKLDEVVSVRVGDARIIDFKNEDKFNVVVSEMLTTGLVDEFQLQAMNNLHLKKVVDDKTVFIPQSQQSFINVSFFDFTIDGFNMPLPRHLWIHNENRHLLKKFSDLVLVNDIKFSKINSDTCSFKFDVEIKESGVINSVYLSSKTILADNIVLDDTISVNAPVVIPLGSLINVKKGDIIKVSIGYKFGGGYNNFSVKIK